MYKEKIQVEPEHYFKNYDNLQRWINYWNQINLIKKLTPKNILEVGIGNKTVSIYLKNNKFDIITIDIDKRLNPDYVGSVLKLPFNRNSFDLVVCFEVLEHLPFEKFYYVLKELYRVADKYVIISLPQSRLSFSLMGQFSLINDYFGFILSIPVPLKHKFDGEHYWEVGKIGFSRNKIRHIIKEIGFDILKEFTPVLDKYHHFYLLEKINNR